MMENTTEDLPRGSYWFLGPFDFFVARRFSEFYGDSGQSGRAVAQRDIGQFLADVSRLEFLPARFVVCCEPRPVATCLVRCVCVAQFCGFAAANLERHVSNSAFYPVQL